MKREVVDALGTGVGAATGSGVAERRQGGAKGAGAAVGVGMHAACEASGAKGRAAAAKRTVSRATTLPLLFVADRAATRATNAAAAAARATPPTPVAAAPPRGDAATVGREAAAEDWLPVTSGRAVAAPLKAQPPTRVAAKAAMAAREACLAAPTRGAAGAMTPGFGAARWVRGSP